MARAHYLIAYDISDAKRLRQVHKIVRAYAWCGQKSFYECALPPKEYQQLRLALTQQLDETHDRLFIYPLSENSQPQFFARAKHDENPFFIF